MLQEMDAVITRARPNPAHYALAELEAKGYLTGIITQNVDNLHQAAGSKRVVEYHGNALRFICDNCRGRHPRETLDFSHPPLYCLCGGLIRPDVVFFGEPIPPAAQAEAEELAQHCDLLLVVGTSGEVAPASYIPHIAREWNAIIAESNLEPTRLTRTLANHFLKGAAGTMLPLVMKEL
jgi:NAD-dependent deacetylase